MIRSVVTVGALALVLAGCASGDPQGPGTAPDVPATSAATAEPGEGSGDGAAVTVPADVCELFDDIQVEALISTTVGSFKGSDDECSVPAADPLEYAQASITIGVAPAMVVIRSNYEGPLFECPVVDFDGLGDAAFSCFGGRASSHVVFAAGEYLVIFSAANTVEGPPADAVMLEAAQQIYANMAG